MLVDVRKKVTGKSPDGLADEIDLAFVFAGFVAARQEKSVARRLLSHFTKSFRNFSVIQPAV